MIILKGERVNLKTLMSLGFKKLKETKNEQVWVCGKNRVGLSTTTKQNPLILWIEGAIFYIGNTGERGIKTPKKRRYYSLRK